MTNFLKESSEDSSIDNGEGLSRSECICLVAAPGLQGPMA